MGLVLEVVVDQEPHVLHAGMDAGLDLLDVADFSSFPFAGMTASRQSRPPDS
jgi:hypothetical protein